MDDDDKISETGTFVPYDHVTSKTKLLRTLGGILDENDGTTTSRVLEAQAALREMTEDSALEQSDQLEASRLSWTQRLLGWFRR